MVCVGPAYAAPAWWGFTSADDRKQLEVFVRGLLLGLYKNDESTVTQLNDELEDLLFHMIMYHEDRVIHHLLPPLVSNTYNLRQRDATRNSSKSDLMRETVLQENCTRTHIVSKYVCM